jgi:hypothetical protein
VDTKVLVYYEHEWSAMGMSGNKAGVAHSPCYTTGRAIGSQTSFWDPCTRSWRWPWQAMKSLHAIDNQEQVEWS